MGTITVTEFVSMDGVMEAPGGEEGYKHTAWTFEFPDEGQYEVKTKETDEAEVMLLGRVTYEGFAAAWPEREQADDEATAGPRPARARSGRRPAPDDLSGHPRDRKADLPGRRRGQARVRPHRPTAVRLDHRPRLHTPGAVGRILVALGVRSP